MNERTIVKIINPKEEGSFRKKVLMKINNPEMNIMDAIRSNMCMAVNPLRHKFNA
tara:strand:+ start:124 stop:288 length:165 start_codon:yes stop_codon:yes gene_type:complete